MSATKCLYIAQALALKELGGVKKDKYPCGCKNGMITISVSTYGSSKPSEAVTMTCPSCQGTGFVSHVMFVSRFIHCRCKHDIDGGYNVFKAKDGHDVFGNDTYLCGICGMVVQFG